MVRVKQGRKNIFFRDPNRGEQKLRGVTLKEGQNKKDWGHMKKERKNLMGTYFEPRRRET